MSQMCRIMVFLVFVFGLGGSGRKPFQVSPGCPQRRGEPSGFWPFHRIGVGGMITAMVGVKGAVEPPATGRNGVRETEKAL